MAAYKQSICSYRYLQYVFMDKFSCLKDGFCCFKVYQDQVVGYGKDHVVGYGRDPEVGYESENNVFRMPGQRNVHSSGHTGLIEATRMRLET